MTWLEFCSKADKRDERRCIVIPKRNILFLWMKHGDCNQGYTCVAQNCKYLVPRLEINPFLKSLLSSALDIPHACALYFIYRVLVLKEREKEEQQVAEWKL